MTQISTTDGPLPKWSHFRTFQTDVTFHLKTLMVPLKLITTSTYW